MEIFIQCPTWYPYCYIFTIKIGTSKYYFQRLPIKTFKETNVQGVCTVEKRFVCEKFSIFEIKKEVFSLIEMIFNKLRKTRLPNTAWEWLFFVKSWLLSLIHSINKATNLTSLNSVRKGLTESNYNYNVIQNFSPKVKISYLWKSFEYKYFCWI